MKQKEEGAQYGGSGCLTALIRFLVVLLILVLLATGALAVYAFKTDTIQDIKVEKISATVAELSVSSLKHSELTVVCSQGGRELARAAVEQETASFSGLEPDTQYTFTVESSGGRTLKGSTTVEAMTDPVVMLNEFRVTGCTAVSATFSLYGTGRQPDRWKLTLTPGSGEPVIQTVTGTEFTIDNLTPETDYSVSISCDDGSPIEGTTSCSLTTAEYTTLESFEQTARSADSMTFSWQFSGTAPENWTVTCTDEAGNEARQTVQDTFCVFGGLTVGETYTITLDCASLRDTELAVLQEKIPVIMITEMECETDDAGNLILTWDYDAELQPERWTITCSCDSAGDQNTIEAEKTEAVLTGLIPYADYRIAVTAADALPVTGTAAETEITTESAAPYSDFGCTDLSLTLYAQEDNPDELTTPSDCLRVGEHLAYQLEVHYASTDTDKTVSTLYVVRNEDGVPVLAYRGDRTWNGAWPVILHEGNLPDSLEEAGSYTFEIYFDGALAAQKSFTVED